METLRGVQLIQNTPPSGQSGPRIGTRRAALDELGCVECLSACAERCADVPRLLSQAQPGLLALAVCLTSSLNRSRVLALQVVYFFISSFYYLENFNITFDEKFTVNYFIFNLAN